MAMRDYGNPSVLLLRSLNTWKSLIFKTGWRWQPALKNQTYSQRCSTRLMCEYQRKNI